MKPENTQTVPPARPATKSHSRLALPFALAVLVTGAGCDTTPLPTGTPTPDSITCTSCHGSGEIPAPPPTFDGKTATTSPGVGAHRAHVQGGALKRPVACDDCHAVPATVDAPGHLDGVVEITWGQLARTAGASPAFDPAAMTCANVYCHGFNLPGGTNKTPQWTKVDGTQAACGTCHDAPPALPHPQNKTCATCHPDPLTGGKHINGVIDRNSDVLTCTSCHGDPATGVAAPPIGTHGETKTTEAGVGAHQKHLGVSDWHRAGECTDCHAIPSSFEHADGTIDFAWGPLSKTRGAAPQFDAKALTCSSVYCHGTELFGAVEGGVTSRTPVWNRVDETFNACGKSCHTNPPGDKHPKSDKCGKCHKSVIDDDLHFVNPQLHVDGIVEVAAECNACHGSEKNNAPPASTTGKTDTTEVSVGAHQSHVTDTDIRKALTCEDCHVVPENVDDPGHMNGTVDIKFGALATIGPTTPLWDHAAATCAAVYCHGATLAGGGGSNTSPKWTKVDGTQATCGTCHGVPPPAPHMARADCHTCHGETVTTTEDINVAGGKHINGQLDITAQCNACHGSADNNAPPVSTTGKTDTTDVSVGAHQSHVKDGPMRKAMECIDCHVVPPTVIAAGHMDGTVDVAFGALAKSDSAAPVWTHATATCAATYCHGGTLGGGTTTAPVWTSVGNDQAKCGACHGLPPPSPHPGKATCRDCHPDTVLADGTIDVAGGKHVDGEVEIGPLTCTSCHGNATNAAPPTGVHGETLTTDHAVGAHQKHLASATWHRDVQCTDCHAIPQVNVHADGQADFTWSAVATGKGANIKVPAYDRTAHTCATVSCHGPNKGGGSNNTPSWTTVDGTQAVCGSCHGLPPPAPHPQMNACEACHTSVITTFTPGTPPTAVWKDRTLHINGETTY